MTYQEILNLLSECECELFHARADNPDNENFREAHEAARKALDAFAREIGL